MKRVFLSVLIALALLGASTGSAIVVTGQILDYEKGWLFLTTGDGFHVAPDATVVNGPAETRRYARITFDGSGVITRIEVSKTKLPPEGDLNAIHRFAVALSPPAPNPDLAPQTGGGFCSQTQAGKLVGVRVVVQVPPSTALTDTVYMTSDQSGWNAQAYRLDRIDAIHYEAMLKFYSGTVLHVLFDRGSTQSIQVGENGLEVKPYLLCVGDEDAQVFSKTVYRWGDENRGGIQPVPQAFPTPYNPAPFPNLPTQPTPLPH